jgi:hypothetical protein
MPDYLITTILRSADEATGVQRQRIVRAKNEAAALKHVVADTITITRATLDDAMRLSGEGVKIENVIVTEAAP